MSSSSGVIPVRVAVRFRPLSEKEVREGCASAVSVHENKQVLLERNGFTFDWAYESSVSQEVVYASSVKDLIPELFKGYNVTVLAYGQTGSGKTHSMGTTNEPSTPEELLGIIPRAIRDIFALMAEQSTADFSCKVSFIELYKESLFDLLSGAKKEDSSLDIREDPRIGLHIAHLTERPVDSLGDTLEALQAGATKRVTAATAMNNVSSRSHAIFTFHINWTNLEQESLSAKFHLVDLAGSERQKKTKATGERLKEGIDINRGLLALGNVIAALGEEGPATHKHIPYRDSKLTRLLQDSLGGNSHTLMIACSSPAESNVDETLSTLRYADRARKIKNKPIVNREDAGKQMEMKRLKSEIASLKLKLGEQEVAGRSPVMDKHLKLVTEKLKEENKELTTALMTVQEELTHLNEGILMTESANEKLKSQLKEMSEEFKARGGAHGEESNAVFSKMEQVLETYKDSERKMVEFEMSRGGNHSLMEMSVEEGGDPDESTTAHALRQNHLANELKSLNKLLAQKEQLADTMNANEEEFKAMKAQYESSIASMEGEIATMNREMEELLRASKKETGLSKVSEGQRKRIQELEGLIQDMKRKLLEQQKAIRLSERDKAKMVKLSSEIMGMKQQKVKLVRQMKEDSEKMRAWKQQKERELSKVKNSERKNLVKLSKMENLHIKQKTVWKRKIEEVAAVNAKLKTILDKQKAAKAMKGSSGLSGAGERVRSFIHDELEVIAGHKEALLARESFIKERTSLKSQLNSCQQELRSTLNASERTEIDLKISHLLSEIDDRSSGISSLQKTLSDLDRVKEVSLGKWEMLSSLTEAKIGLEYLIDQCSSAQASLALLRNDHEVSLKNNESLSKTNAELQKKLDMLSSVHEDQIVSLSREHEEKVLFLLRQCQGEGNVDERIRIQETEINKMSHLNEVLIQMKDENSRLKSELDHNKFPAPSIGGKPIHKTKVLPHEQVEETEEEDMSMDEGDDYNKDPDWKKTPLYRRIISLKERSSLSSSSSSSLNIHKRKLDMADLSEEEDASENEDKKSPPKTRKRSSASSLVGCRCKGKCDNSRCSCRKKGNSCSDCSCQPETCSNRSSPLTDISNTEGHTLSILNSDDSLNGSKEDHNALKYNSSSKDEARRRVSHFNPPTIP